MDWSTITKLFLFFALWAFLGWLVEEIWVAIQRRKFMNRGFLIGPFCPIYGLGAIFVLFLAYPLRASPPLVFLVSALACAGLEYFTSLFMEKMFGARWWDYSHKRFNLAGRICLSYTIIFGLGGLAIVYFAAPAFWQLLALIPEQILYILAIVLAVGLLLDHLVSMGIIRNFKKIRKSGEKDDTDDITAYVRNVLAERGRLYRRLNSFDFVIGRRATLHYSTLEDDLIENSGQNYQLPQDYRWIRQKSRPLLYALGKIWARFYRFYTGTKYVNPEILTITKAPIFIYANHTQPLGDILAPLDYCRDRRVRFLAAPANLGLPILGKFLPDLGALPVPSTVHGLAELDAAITHYSKLGSPIIIYPEAHVWPYYTGIRPFSHASLAYPVRGRAATFTAVTTYQKRRFIKKPRRVIYFDGPFYADEKLPRRAQVKDLHQKVTASMKNSAKRSNQKYIRYVKKRQGTTP